MTVSEFDSNETTRPVVAVPAEAGQIDASDIGGAELDGLEGVFETVDAALEALDADDLDAAEALTASLGDVGDVAPVDSSLSTEG